VLLRDEKYVAAQKRRGCESSMKLQLLDRRCCYCD
jgi:hypothetical protein